MKGGFLAVIEAGADPDYAAFERAESRRPSTAASAVGAPRRHRRTLAELPPTPVAPVRPSALVVEAEAHEIAEVPRPAADPLGHLRTARLGFALVVVLALYGLWSWQRRRQ